MDISPTKPKRVKSQRMIQMKLKLCKPREEILAKKAAWKRADLAKRRATDPEYRKWKAEKDHQYRQTPEGKMRDYRNKMRRKAQGAGTHILKVAEWNTLLRVFNNQCAYCLESKPLVRDHFIPLIFGGATSIKNIVPACHKCNSNKSAQMPNDWCSPEQYHRVLNVLAALEPTCAARGA